MSNEKYYHGAHMEESVYDVTLDEHTKSEIYQHWIEYQGKFERNRYNSQH